MVAKAFRVILINCNVVSNVFEVVCSKLVYSLLGVLVVSSVSIYGC